MARQLATLDHLSNGRAGWNVVTSSDAFTGENFRRGGFLDYDDRYIRAGEFIRFARDLWDSWAADELVADQASGQFVRHGPPGAFDIHGEQFDVRGHFTLPRSPQRHPVILQAGDSDGGRELAAQTSDGIFSRHSRLADGQAFYKDVKSRLAKLRPPPRRAQDPAGGDVRARRHARRRRREGPLHPPPAGQPADGDPHAGAGLEPRPVVVRRRGPAARDRSRRVGAVDHPGSGPDARRQAGDGQELARAGRRPQPVDPRADHRGHRPAVVHRHAGDGGRRDRHVRAGGRRRRRDPRAPPHAARARRVRRPGRAAAPGARLAARRVHDGDASRSHRPAARCAATTCRRRGRETRPPRDAAGRRRPHRRAAVDADPQRLRQRRRRRSAATRRAAPTCSRRCCRPARSSATTRRTDRNGHRSWPASTAPTRRRRRCCCSATSTSSR